MRRVFYYYLTGRAAKRNTGKVSLKGRMTLDLFSNVNGWLSMETIAIAEDEPIFIELILNFLKIDGYNFVTAYDGIKAQRILKRTGNEIKAIILDWMMPKLCGI